MLLRMCFIIQGGNHVVKRTIFPVTGEVHLTSVSTRAIRPGVSRTEHTMSSTMSCDMMIMMVMDDDDDHDDEHDDADEEDDNVITATTMMTISKIIPSR